MAARLHVTAMHENLAEQIPRHVERRSIVELAPEFHAERGRPCSYDVVAPRSRASARAAALATSAS